MLNGLKDKTEPKDLSTSLEPHNIVTSNTIAVTCYVKHITIICYGSLSLSHQLPCCILSDGINFALGQMSAASRNWNTGVVCTKLAVSFWIYFLLWLNPRHKLLKHKINVKISILYNVRLQRKEQNKSQHCHLLGHHNNTFCRVYMNCLSNMYKHAWHIKCFYVFDTFTNIYTKCSI